MPTATPKSGGQDGSNGGNHMFPRFLKINDASRAEVTVRMAIVSFASFALAIADIPEVVPLSVSYGLGILGSCFAVAFPYMIYALSVTTPVLIAVFLYSMMFATALLAAATVSSGLMVTMYAVGSFLLCGLYFGETSDKTSSMPGTIIALMGMFALGYRSLVQNGIQFSVDKGALGSTGDLRDELPFLCSTGPSLGESCWVDWLPLEDLEREFQLPESAGIFAGETAYISTTSSSVDVDIPGGLWIVKGLWAWQGLGNPLAAFRNFMIAVCWALACWWLGVLLPPFRTARKATSRALVPAALNTTAQTVTWEALVANKGKLAHMLQSIGGGKAAKLTLFEPRIFRAPTQFLVPELTNLLLAVEQVMLGCAAVVVWNQDGDSNAKTENLKESLSVLNACAKALASNDDADRASLKRFRAETEHPMSDSTSDLSTYIRTRCDKVKETTLAWLDALNHSSGPSLCSKEAAKNIAKVCLPWVLLPLLPFKRAVDVLKVAFHFNQWSWISILWSLKLTVGFVGLFSATVYSEAWGDFAIEPNYGTVGGVFAGWQLISFAFVTRPTIEGTVKKGLQRVLGTLVGGFMAWLGIIVCRWSYSDNAEINAYALTAWLTVTTTIVGYFTVDNGDAARMGASFDHGYIGTYYVLAQSLIALEVYRDQGSNNAITVNRIVSNLAGIGTAIVIGSIPPFVRGNDPQHTADYLTSLNETLSGLIAMLLDEDDSRRIGSDGYKASFLRDASSKRQLALYLLKDAGRVRALPFFRQDARLEPLVESMFVDEPLLARLLDLTVNVAADSTVDLNEGSVARVELEQILARHNGQWKKAVDSSKEVKLSSNLAESLGEDNTEASMEEHDIEASDPDASAGVADSAPDSLCHFFSLAETISRRLDEHQTELDAISPVRSDL